MKSQYAAVNALRLTWDEIKTIRIGAKRNALDIGRTPLGQRIARIMRGVCLVEGDSWDKFMTVLLQPGDQIKLHSHKRHTLLFYPEVCEPLLVGSTCLFPGAGTVIYIAPGVEHGVPFIKKRPRLSIAMLVSGKMLEAD